MGNLPENRLIVRLDTVLLMPADRSLKMVELLLDDLRALTTIEKQTDFFIRELVSGSWWVDLLLIGGGVGACVSGAQSLAEKIRSGETPFAREVANELDRSNGNNCTIIAGEIEIIISRDEMDTPLLENSALKNEKVSQYRHSGRHVFTSIPENKPVERKGSFESLAGGLYFEMGNEYGRVDNVVQQREIVLGAQVVASVIAVRGDHGGYADRGLEVIDWRFADSGQTRADEAAVTSQDANKSQDEESKVLVPRLKGLAPKTIGATRKMYSVGTFSKDEDSLVWHFITTEGQKFEVHGVVASFSFPVGRAFWVSGRVPLEEAYQHRFYPIEIRFSK